MSKLVISGGDASPLLELGEEALDAPSLFVGDTVIRVLMFAMSAGWDDRLATLFEDDIVEAVGVIGAIGEHLVGGQATDQITGRCHIILLTRSDIKTYRQTKSIDYSMDFGPEASS